MQERKKYIQNPAICSYENAKYIASIIDDSGITFDEIIEETKTIPRKRVSTKTFSTSSNGKKVTCKTKSFHILLIFLLTTIVLLIAFSINCYLRKY